MSVLVADSQTHPSFLANSEHDLICAAEEADGVFGIDDGAEDLVEYRYLETETGTIIPVETVHWDESELSDGAVLHTCDESGKKQYYTVSRMVQNEVVSVYLDRARNRAWKFLVLAALLVGCWFVIEFLLHQFV